MSILCKFLVADTRLHLAVSVGKSVGKSVGPSVRPSHFWIPSGFCITDPAQPSAVYPALFIWESKLQWKIYLLKCEFCIKKVTPFYHAKFWLNDLDNTT